MKRIENEDDRLITFSKRKSRTYNKASELVTLTGAEIGHPSIEAVANRFLGQTRRQMTTLLLVEAQRQKERGNFLKQMTKGKETQRWWETPV
ncbi:hypothetical protein CISIN_1g038327mg, partial [Citrus sinensis]